MKMSQWHYGAIHARMQVVIAQHSIDEIKRAMTATSRTRVLWDLYHYCQHANSCSHLSSINAIEIYAYLNDANIETALKAIGKEFGI